MTERDYQLLNLRYSCPLLRRDQILEGKVPTAPTIASMMAALAGPGGAQAAPRPARRGGHGHGLQRGDEPVLHDAAPVPRRLPEPRDLPRAGRAAARPSATPSPSCSTRPGATLAGPLTLALDRDLVVGDRLPAMRLARRGVPAADRRCARPRPICPNCREPAGPRSSAPSRRTRRWPTGPLAEVGIPPYDIVRVDGAAESGFFLLAADRGRRLGLTAGWRWSRACGGPSTATALSSDEIVFDEVRYREPERLLPARPRPPLRLPGLRGARARRPADLPRPPHGRRDRAARPARHVGRAGRHPAGQGVRRRPDGPAVRLGHPVARGQALREHPGELHLHPRLLGGDHPRARPAAPRPRHRGLVSHASRLRDLPVAATTCSSTATSSPSRSRWPTSSTRSARPAGSSSGATATLAQVGGFYLTADRGDRIALARLVNDLENIPNADGGRRRASPPAWRRS